MKSFTSPYDQVVARKRKWTPVAVQKGKVVEGAEALEHIEAVAVGMLTGSEVSSGHYRPSRCALRRS